MIITINDKDRTDTFNSKDISIISYEKNCKTKDRKFDVLVITLKSGDKLIYYSYRIPELKDVCKKMIEIMEDNDGKQ